MRHRIKSVSYTHLDVYKRQMHKRSIMDAIIKDIIDDARPMVTKDMARRGYAKLGITKSQIVQRCLPNISDRKLDDLHIYYFSWFYANKGVIVGRRISQFLEDVYKRQVLCNENKNDMMV